MNGSIKFNCCTYLSLIMIFFQLWSLLLLFLKMHYLNTFSFKVIFFFHIQNKGYISLCCGDHSVLFGVGIA